MTRMVRMWVSILIVCGIMMGTLFDLDDNGPMPTDAIAVGLAILPSPACCPSNDQAAAPEE